MNPVSRSIIDKKKRVILKELNLLDGLRQVTIGNDSELEQQHILCHSMQNVISAVIDIAQHIATEAGRDFANYFESIKVLGDLKILDADFAEEFARIAKLRNVLVHLYDDININHLYSLMPKLVEQTKQFLKAIKDL